MNFFGSTTIGNWSITYEKAIRDDGSLLFPEKLGHKRLQEIREEQGSYIFANQYLNIIIPEDEQRFRPEWNRNWFQLPEKTLYHYAFIDPAIGQKDHHDFTAVIVISVDQSGHWYVRIANRYRLSVTQIVSKIFEIHQEFKPKFIGVEQVAFQEAILQLTDLEMKRRGVVIPVQGVTRSKESKQTRILQLVPRFEWGRIFLQHGMTDLEDELSTFPRGSHDDLLDALASLTEFAVAPSKESTEIKEPHSPYDRNYERWIIQQMIKNQGEGLNGHG